MQPFLESTRIILLDSFAYFYSPKMDKSFLDFMLFWELTLGAKIFNDKLCCLDDLGLALCSICADLSKWKEVFVGLLPTVLKRTFLEFTLLLSFRRC